MFIETSAKAGYNVKQVCVSLFDRDMREETNAFISFLFQLFRRVAAALPGMETPERRNEDCKLVIDIYIFTECYICFQ
jgi:hypothetical protein